MEGTDLERYNLACPPIPPNCPEFVEMGADENSNVIGYWFSIPNTDAIVVSYPCATRYDTNHLKPWKRIIAAYAVLGWQAVTTGLAMDEFVKRSPLETDWREVANSPEYVTALANAEAWKVWGGWVLAGTKESNT